MKQSWNSSDIRTTQQNSTVQVGQCTNLQRPANALRLHIPLVQGQQFDSKSANPGVLRVSRRNTDQGRMQYDADLLAFLRSELKELQCSLIPEWGRGNHDALNFYDHGPLAEQR
jgi:hypothetical protein